MANRVSYAKKMHVVECALNGMSYRSIARELHIDKATVSKILREYREAGNEPPKFWQDQAKEAQINRIGWNSKHVQGELCRQGLVTYKLSEEEIIKRYGRPGEHRE